MSNPYLPPEAPVRTGLELATRSSGFDGAPSVFLTTALALVGASAVQAAGVVPMLAVGRSTVPTNIYGMLWVWFAVTGLAVCCGLLGGYRSLRRASVGNGPLLVFLLLYSVTVRVENASFGWPFQLHAGIVFGRIGVGLNLVGVGMILWWMVIKGRHTTRASLLGAVDHEKAVMPEVS